MSDVRNWISFLESDPDPLPHYRMKAGALVRPEMEDGTYTVRFDAGGRTFRFNFGDLEGFVEKVKMEATLRTIRRLAV